jgi:aminoglycoside phosphotransferase (APT) family kinase protein
MDLQILAERIAGMAFGGEPAFVSDTRLMPGNSSLVYRLEYTLPGRRKSIYVKLPEDSAEPLENARRLTREFRVTQAVKAALPDTPALRTVAPVGYLADNPALATWELPGVSLQSLLNSGLRFRRTHGQPRLAAQVALAGTWLRRFHGLGLAAGSLDLRRSLEYCRKRLDHLAALPNSGISKLQAERLTAVVADWVEELSDSPDTQAVLCHNDYSPHNILVTETGVGILDFSFAAPGLKMFDLACFWHKLEDLKSSPLYSPSAVEALQREFLAAYGADFDTRRPDVALGLMRLVLSKLVVLCLTHSRRPDTWLEKHRRHSRYLAFLDSCSRPAQA